MVCIQYLESPRCITFCRYCNTPHLFLRLLHIPPVSNRLLHVRNGNCKYHLGEETFKLAQSYMDKLAKHGHQANKAALYGELCALLFAKSHYDEVGFVIKDVLIPLFRSLPADEYIKLYYFNNVLLSRLFYLKMKHEIIQCYSYCHVRKHTNTCTSSHARTHTHACMHTTTQTQMEKNKHINTHGHSHRNTLHIFIDMVTGMNTRASHIDTRIHKTIDYAMRLTIPKTQSHLFLTLPWR